MIRAPRTLLASITFAALLGGLGSAALAAAVPRSLDSGSASHILARSLADARQQHSVHVVEVEHAGKSVLTQTDNSNERSGEQQLVFSTGAQVDIRLFRTTLFIKANAKGIVLVYGKTDPTYSNKWISVASSNAAYKTLANGIDFTSLIAEMPPSGKLTKSRIETVAGHRVIAIHGRPNQVAQKVDGSETFDVSTSPPYLPPRITGRLSGNGHSATLTISFSDWSRNFVIATPSPSIEITSTNLLHK
ncbi:MAG TPA: hypothetical protein VGZ33_02170 [Acidimicrobiales bacterium]|nr:hypothetical protein [Acidimicrobiales bacterium]